MNLEICFKKQMLKKGIATQVELTSLLFGNDKESNTSTLSQIIHGKRPVPKRRLIKFAEFLEIRPYVLVRHNGKIKRGIPCCHAVRKFTGKELRKMAVVADKAKKALPLRTLLHALS